MKGGHGERSRKWSDWGRAGVSEEMLVNTAEWRNTLLPSVILLCHLDTTQVLQGCHTD